MTGPTAPPPGSGYRTGIGNIEGDRAAVLALWRGNLGDASRHADKYDWFYRGCPFGQPLLMLLWHDDRLVGCAAAGPRPMLHRGRPFRAGLLVDFTVLPEHRTLGPALQLQEAMLGAASERFDLLYGFPNPRAVPVCRRAGLQKLASLPRYARVARHGPYLRRRLPAWLAAPAGAVVDGGYALLDRWRGRGVPRRAMRWCDEPGAATDSLWRDSPHADGVLAIRDRAMLEWRCARSPLEEIRFLELLAPDGALEAWFACREAAGVLDVADFWTTGGSRKMSPGVLQALLRAARRRGCRAVSVELIAAPALLEAWQRAGFRPREARPLLGRWLHGPEAGAADPAPLHITSLDEDE